MTAPRTNGNGVAVYDPDDPDTSTPQLEGPGEVTPSRRVPRKTFLGMVASGVFFVATFGKLRPAWGYLSTTAVLCTKRTV